MKTLTIRNLPSEVAEALEKERAHQGQSLNQTAIDLSRGLGSGGARSNGLAGLAGKWTEKEFRRFEEAVTPLAEIDAEIW